MPHYLVTDVWLDQEYPVDTLVDVEQTVRELLSYYEMQEFFSTWPRTDGFWYSDVIGIQVERVG